MLKLATVAAVIAASLAVAGCSKEEPAATAANADQPVATADGDVPMVNCVICGDHQFPLEDTTARSDVEGDPYYFCSDYCKEKFDAEPSQYVSVEAPATQPAQ